MSKNSIEVWALGEQARDLRVSSRPRRLITEMEVGDLHDGEEGGVIIRHAMFLPGMAS